MEKAKNNYEFKLFNVRLPEHEPYFKITKSWWANRQWTIPSPEVLSTTGIMVYLDHKPVCAGWLYQTDSLMAVIGFLIADTETVGKAKKEGIKFLLLKLEEMAKSFGFSRIFMPMEAAGVARLCQKELHYMGGKTNELIKDI